MPLGTDIIRWQGDGLAPASFTTSSAGSGDTPAGSVVGSTMSVDASGVRSPRIKWTGGNTGYGVWGTNASSTMAWRWYNEFTTAGGGFRAALAWTGSAAAWVLDVNSAGAVLLLDNGGGTLDQTASGFITSGQVYRIEVTYNAGQTDVYLYAGESLTPLDVLSASQSSLSITEFWWGTTFDTSRGDAYGDDLAIARRTATQIGPRFAPAVAENAAVTAAANTATPKVSPGSQVANVAAAANDATVSAVGGGASSSAGNAAVTTTANQPTVTIQSPAGNAAVTVAGLGATSKVAPSAQNASVTAAGLSPTATVQTGSGNAAVTATANQPTISIKPGAENAPVNATANQPTVQTGSFTTANAQNAAVTAAANGTTSKVSTGVQNAAVTVSTSSAAAVRTNAALAAAAVVVNNAAANIGAAPSSATVSTQARDPGGKVLVGAGVAPVAAAAGDITSVVPAAFTDLEARPTATRYTAKGLDNLVAAGPSQRYSVE